MDFDTRVGAYAVIIRDAQVLLTHFILDQGHPTAADAAGWTLPGGGLEVGESPEVAAVREVFEETGYRVELLGLLGTDSVHYTADQRLPGRPARPLHSLRFVFAAHIVGGELRCEVNGSTDDVRWVPLSEAGSLDRVGLVDVGIELWHRTPGPSRHVSSG